MTVSRTTVRLCKWLYREKWGFNPMFLMFIGSIVVCGFLGILAKDKHIKDALVWLPLATTGALIPLTRLVLIWDMTKPDEVRGRSFGGPGMMVARNPATSESPSVSVPSATARTEPKAHPPVAPAAEPHGFQITDEELEKLIGENNEPFG